MVHAATLLKGPISRSRPEWAEVEVTEQECPSEEGIRQDLVARVRRQIAAGTYDTPEKWEAALEQFLDRLGCN